ncbi:MAG TPA: DUF3892 domain-containing protein [Candidatus Bathyarchaeia archaeon]|nr:DUF3892 domain-containing protein [Candidatus Bathyarchaeia archaeon]
MITVTALVLTRERKGFGFVIVKDGVEMLVSQSTLISMAEDTEINGAYVRKENDNGDEHIFVDLDEEVTENLLYEDEALQKYKVIH